MLSDDDNEDESETELEKKSRKIDEERERQMEEAELDLQESTKDHFKWVPPSEEELTKEKQTGVDMKVVKERMLQNLECLSDFKRYQAEGISRNHYLKVLKEDAAYYYGYIPYLIEKIFQLFPPAEALEFLEANGSPRPVTIRVNTLKTRRKDLKSALLNRGINLEDIEWTPIGIQVFESPIPIGATPEYLAGHYMIQSASSWTPVLSLDPQPGERVLDMAAAPGGKTTHIAALMKNSGELFANDVNASRSKALTANIHRMGVTNAIVTNYDGIKLPKHFPNYFDRVLLDAPCTGLGVVSKDPSVKVKRNAEDLHKLSYHQKQLILAAIDSINPNSKTGGYLVYSTCSISTEENEAVVDYLLRKRGVKLVDTGLPFGKPGYVKCQEHKFDQSVKMSRRFYPHVYNMDGFYVAKFKKLSNWKAGKREGENDPEEVATQTTENKEATKDNNSKQPPKQTNKPNKPKKNPNKPKKTAAPPNAQKRSLKRKRTEEKKE
uniref:SAM-dependent MTase RsmB/NOP-type domain-containing protein n=1 Tax=Arcella intermedia TaxID=1963864 RepID=A0A6B2L1W4_9EUKA